MDDRAKRRLSLRKKTNQELFALYYDYLKVRLSPGQVIQYSELLDKLHNFLGEFPPSTELVTQFLAQYANRSRATLVRYAGILRGFMSWYGEDLDIRPVKPKSLPQYVDPADIERLIDTMRAKKNHKATIARDILLVRFATKTGLRRGELASLKTNDILLKQQMVIVRNGKGEKDRSIPLEDSLVIMLEEYLKTKKPTDKIFGLADRSITDLIRVWARKANVQLHPHSFRHHFAEQLIEKGVPIKVVKELLGHENLETTSLYLGLRPGSMRDAINKLGVSDLQTEGENSVLKERTDNSKKKTIETIQLDPLLQEKRREHLNIIQSQIETRRNRIHALDIASVQTSHYYLIANPMRDLEEDAHFTLLKQHIPDSTLWEIYEKWKSKYVKYLISHEILREKIIKQGEIEFSLTYFNGAPNELSGPCLVWDFAQPFFEIFNCQSQRAEIELAIDSGESPIYGLEYLFAKSTIKSGSNFVLLAESAEDYIKKYQKMVDDFKRKQEVTSLIDLLLQIRKFEKEIRDYLDLNLERGDYIHYYCERCPKDPIA